MFETTLSIDASRQWVLDKIERKLEYSLKGMNRICVRGSMGERAYMSLACEEYNREFVCDCLSYIVAEIIVTNFKSDYIKTNSKFVTANEVSYLAFVEALVAFDRESDKELVLGSLEIGENNMLDGIYNFQMGEIKKRWDEVLALAGENNKYLMYKDTFLELMKFLVGTLDPKVEEVEIELGKNGFVISSNSEIAYELSEGEGKLEALLPMLIDLAPKRIKLKNADLLSENIKSIYQEIYSDRTIFC